MHGMWCGDPSTLALFGEGPLFEAHSYMCVFGIAALPQAKETGREGGKGQREGGREGRREGEREGGTEGGREGEREGQREGGREGGRELVKKEKRQRLCMEHESTYY